MPPCTWSRREASGSKRGLSLEPEHDLRHSGAMNEGLLSGEDRLARCWWCGSSPLYVDYHDEEWGRPVDDDRRLFEKLCLEAFQSGLSWNTILVKRENFRAAFDNFELREMARYDGGQVERLLGDAGIVRHRGKIEAVLHNAQAALELIAAEGSLAKFVWGFEPPAAERPKRLDRPTLGGLGKTPASTALAKALKNRGWKFVGPTTAYAFMQSMGLVNDHLTGCHVRAEIEAERTDFVRP